MYYTENSRKTNSYLEGDSLNQHLIIEQLGLSMDLPRDLSNKSKEVIGKIRWIYHCLHLDMDHKLLRLLHHSND